MVAVETILAAQIALLRQLEDEVAKTVSLVEMMASDGLGIDLVLGGGRRSPSALKTILPA